MQYALLIYEKLGAYDTFSDEERRATTAEYARIRNDPRVVGGARLKPIETATTVRAHKDETLITDGPFAETKEVFGGYFLLEAECVDDALEIAERIPAVRLGGAVEVRPLLEPEH